MIGRFTTNSQFRQLFVISIRAELLWQILARKCAISLRARFNAKRTEFSLANRHCPTIFKRSHLKGVFFCSRIFVQKEIGRLFGELSTHNLPMNQLVESKVFESRFESRFLALQRLISIELIKLNRIQLDLELDELTQQHSQLSG